MQLILTPSTFDESLINSPIVFHNDETITRKLSLPSINIVYTVWNRHPDITTFKETITQQIEGHHDRRFMVINDHKTVQITPSPILTAWFSRYFVPILRKQVFMRYVIRIDPKAIRNYHHGSRWIYIQRENLVEGYCCRSIHDVWWFLHAIGVEEFQLTE